MARKQLTKWLPILLVALAIPIWLFPIASTAVHSTQIAVYAAVFIWLAAMARRKRPVLMALAAVPIVIVAFLLAPSKPVDTAELMSLYMRNLARYEGSLYVWGGENKLGVDCSGLPRKSLRLAYLELGFKTYNGASIREYMKQWWYDASARALSEGYRGYATPLGIDGEVRTADLTKLGPGDLAITKSGIHVMVYFGEGKWIQADPGVGRVVILDGRKSTNSWFKAPVRFYRWSVFQTAASGAL